MWLVNAWCWGFLRPGPVWTSNVFAQGRGQGLGVERPVSFIGAVGLFLFVRVCVCCLVSSRVSGRCGGECSLQGLLFEAQPCIQYLHRKDFRL